MAGTRIKINKSELITAINKRLADMRECKRWWDEVRPALVEKYDALVADLAASRSVPLGPPVTNQIHGFYGGNGHVRLEEGEVRVVQRLSIPITKTVQAKIDKINALADEIEEGSSRNNYDWAIERAEQDLAFLSLGDEQVLTISPSSEFIGYLV